jgi:hypothetical protein
MPEYYEDLITTMDVLSIEPRGAAAGGKTKKTEPSPMYFKSNIMGRKIVYGDTGFLTNHIVGSADENLYFKVRLVGIIGGVEEAPTLFYDNPRDYCVHFLTRITKHKSPNIRQKIENMLEEIAPQIAAWELRRNAYVDVLTEQMEVRERGAVMV